MDPEAQVDPAVEGHLGAAPEGPAPGDPAPASPSPAKTQSDASSTPATEQPDAGASPTSPDATSESTAPPASQVSLASWPSVTSEPSVAASPPDAALTEPVATPAYVASEARLTDGESTSDIVRAKPDDDAGRGTKGAGTRSVRASLVVAFLLGVGVMGVVTAFVVHSVRRNAAAAIAAAAAAVPPPVLNAGIMDAVAAPAPPPVAAPPPKPPVWRVASLANDPTVQLAQGEVGKRTMLAALTAAGLGKPEVFRVIKAFDDVKSLDHCTPKDTYAFAKDKESGKVMAFEYATSPLEIWQARDHDGALEAAKLDLQVDEKRVAVGVAVSDDLRASIVQAGLDDDLLKMLDDALEGHAELADLRPGARLRIVATEDRVDGAFVRYAALDAVEYTPANPSAPKLRVYWYDKAPSAHGDARDSHESHGHTGAFYDAKGQQPYHGGWRSPVPLARIASRFNPHRMHPVLHIVMPHNGVDFAAPPGTPIYASAAGIVKSVGDGGPCGNMAQIQHPNGLTSAYCHMQRFAAGLHVGQHVDQRQLVGYVGQTGRATGPHLHFAIKKGDVFLDPLAFKLDGVRVLPPSMRDDFAKTRVEMDLALEAIALPAPVAGAASAEGGAAAATTDETVFDDSPGLE